MELTERQFIKGFNAGYFLAEYEPQLLTSLLKNIQPTNSYISGLSFGQKEYELELQTNHLDDLKKIRNKGKNSREAELD